MVQKAKAGINRQAEMKGIDKSDFSLWTLAKAGVEGYNSISDRDLELMVRKNEDGKVKSYALIEDNHLVWAKDLDKN
jgi:hypothetical protein